MNPVAFANLMVLATALASVSAEADLGFKLPYAKEGDASVERTPRVAIDPTHHSTLAVGLPDSLDALSTPA